MRRLGVLGFCLAMVPLPVWAQSIAVKAYNGFAVLSEDMRESATDRCASDAEPVALQLTLQTYAKANLSEEFLGPIKSSILIRRGSETIRNVIPAVDAEGRRVRGQTEYDLDPEGFSATLSGCLWQGQLVIKDGRIDLDGTPGGYAVKFNQDLKALSDMTETSFRITYETAAFENAGAVGTRPRFSRFLSLTDTAFDGLQPVGRLTVTLKDYPLRFRPTDDNKPTIEGTLNLETRFHVFDRRTKPREG